MASLDMPPLVTCEYEDYPHVLGSDCKQPQPACTCDLDLLAHDERATHAYGCPAFVPKLEA